MKTFFDGNDSSDSIRKVKCGGKQKAVDDAGFVVNVGAAAGEKWLLHPSEPRTKCQTFWQRPRDLQSVHNCVNGL
jgi:hypothetical protein